MLFDVTSVPPAVSSDIDLPSHADVRFCFLNEIELLGFHSDLCVLLFLQRIEIPLETFPGAWN